jgi:hypothetical protein
VADPTFYLSPDGKHVHWEHDCLITWTNEPGDQEIERTSVMLPTDPEHGWMVKAEDPLTVFPSILCTGCKTHGFITNGEWVSV